MIPILETARLRLRAHRVEDFADCAKMWADPEVVRYIGGKPSSDAQTWNRMMAYRGHWELMGFGYWALELKASGHYIGEAGFADFRRGIDPQLAGLPEMGWALSRSFHGQGLATEALLEIQAWGDANFDSETYCLIDPQHLASLRVAEKLGFREWKRVAMGETFTTAFLKASSGGGLESDP